MCTLDAWNQIITQQSSLQVTTNVYKQASKTLSQVFKMKVVVPITIILLCALANQATAFGALNARRFSRFSSCV
jgi:hypothetical protein